MIGITNAFVNESSGSSGGDVGNGIYIAVTNGSVSSLIEPS